MEKKKSPLSIRIFYWLSNIALGLLSLVFVAALVFNVVLNTTDFFGKDMQLHTNFPVKVDFLKKGILRMNNENLEVEFVEAIPRIHFIDTPDFITKKVALVLLVVILLGGFLTWTFRMFLKNVKEGKVFNVDNIKLLKRLAYGLLGLWLFNIIYNKIFYYYIAKQLEFENIRISSEIQDLNATLAMALFIWILAHIFNIGLKLQEEKDLTI